MRDLGMIPVGKEAPDELAPFLKDEIVRWAKIVETAGLAKSSDRRTQFVTDQPRRTRSTVSFPPATKFFSTMSPISYATLTRPDAR